MSLRLTGDSDLTCICRRERERSYCYEDDSAQFPGGVHGFCKSDGATGSKFLLSEEHRKQETTPISLPGIDYRRIVFFPAWQQANAKQMQGGTEVVSPTQEQAGLHLSATVVSVSAHTGGNSEWHSWSRDFCAN